MKKTTYEALEADESMLLGKLKNRVKMRIRIEDIGKQGKKKSKKENEDKVWSRFRKGLK